MVERSRGAETVGAWVVRTITETAGSGNEIIPVWRLSEVSTKPSLWRYLQQVWARRFFILADARAKAFATSRGTLLGKVWLVLSPFLDAFMYFVTFGLLLRTGRGIENFLAYLVVGLNVFYLLRSGLTSAGGIIPANRNLIHAFSFPRVSLVFSWAIRQLLDFLPVLAAVLVFIVVVPPGVAPSLIWMLAIPLIFLAWLFSLGTALIVSSSTARLPDLKFIWALLGRFWFYGSGVFFSTANLDLHSTAGAIMAANPGFQVISMARDILVYANMPSLCQWVYLATWSGVLFVLGLVVFWSHEESYGREA